MMVRRARAAGWMGWIAMLLIGLGGCAAGAPDLGPPEGWEGSGAQWWRAGVDTAGMFRDLETLEAMNVPSAPPGDVRNVGTAQYVHAVKRSLIRLYRNQPQVVDSLFERFVRPQIEENPPSGDLGQYIDQYKRRGYDLIRSHFREPIARTRLGEDVEVPFPDSLRGRGITGTVNMQVFLGADGKPQAIELLSGVHPVLDALAMQATAQMEWRPAYYRRNGNWRELPSWQRFNITFGSSS